MGRCRDLSGTASTARLDGAGIGRAAGDVVPDCRAGFGDLADRLCEEFCRSAGISAFETYLSYPAQNPRAEAVEALRWMANSLPLAVRDPTRSRSARRLPRSGTSTFSCSQRMPSFRCIFRTVCPSSHRARGKRAPRPQTFCSTAPARIASRERFGHASGREKTLASVLTSKL